MNQLEKELRRMSRSQLRALFLLSKSKHGIVSSSASSDTIHVKGKALGGVFSSLVRHRIGGEPFILPWGRSDEGRGLRWKLNDKAVRKNELERIVSELLAYDD